MYCFSNTSLSDLYQYRDKRDLATTMVSSKSCAFLFICMLFVSSLTPILGCGYCGKPPPKHKKTKPKTHKTPKTPISVPPIVKPPIVKPPAIIPPIHNPPVTVPPITVPPILKPPGIIPPITGPPATTNPGTPCPPPPNTPAQTTCPINTLKLGACVDLLGGLVHIGLGDPVVNQCCPVLQGLVELEAAVCLCTTLKLRLLNLNIYVPLALQLLITCGKAPPPGYTCTL